MDSFSRIEQSDRKFNIIFATSASIIVSVLMIGLITFLGFAMLSFCWVVYAILVLAPVIVYAIASTQSASYEMAYYKKWQDKIIGILDRGKIFKAFRQKYNINSLKARASELKVDGRWHFKISTSHVRSLITEKNAILLHLEKERIHEEERLDEIIEKQNNLLENEKTENDALKDDVKSLRELLKNAIAAGAIFKIRCDLDVAQNKLNKSNIRINDAIYELNVAKKQKDEAIKDFANASKRAKDYYYLRYQNYTKSAIRTINSVNGLKYTIEDMMEDK